MVRAKFYITTIAPSHGGKGGQISLTPVYSNNPEHPNRKFWEATPTGKVDVYITKQEAFDYFATQMGKEFYVDFTAVDNEDVANVQKLQEVQGGSTS